MESRRKEKGTKKDVQLGPQSEGTSFGWIPADAFAAPHHSHASLFFFFLLSLVCVSCTPLPFFERSPLRHLPCTQVSSKGGLRL